MKKYIWGFPGIGKSSLKLDGLTVVDADCRLFEFKGVSNSNLHSNGEQRSFERDSSYPQNYIDYIKSVDADIVLLNCHLSLLEDIDKESVLVVYPSRWLLSEYMERYVSRGDSVSFVSYMISEAPRMIEYINRSDFKKYQVFTVNTYLNDLFERNDFKMKLMVWSELAEHLQRAKDLNVLRLAEDGKTLVCDIENLGDASIYEIAAGTLADDIFKGKYTLDIDQMLQVCDAREAEIEKERVALERRGGLSREELEDKIMQGIVNGAFGIEYAEIAPYSHGYEVTYGGDGPVGSTRDFKNRWECYCGFFDIPGKIADMIENERQSGRVFGSSAQPLDIKELLSAIDETEGKQIKKFVPEKETDFERWGSRGYGSRGSIASVMDVHAGKGLDGIVQHHYHGDYSSMTPTSQNSLVETLVFMKGFCLDCLNYLDIGIDGRQKVVEYLKKHGTDISTPEKLQEWIIANPEKCGKEGNRVRELYGRAYKDFVRLNNLVNEFNGYLEELCKELGGHNFDGELFDVNYGVLCATVNEKDGKLVLNQQSIDVWNDKLSYMVKECITVNELKTVCKQLGFDIQDLEDLALGAESEKEKAGLDDVIRSCDEMSKNHDTRLCREPNIDKER